MRFSERSTSIWKATEPAFETTPLQEHLDADVCIVGAGITGLSVAYELTLAGREVVVLDDNAIGGGETAQTTAHLSSALDDGFAMLERLHGAEGARLAYDSHNQAIARIERIVADEKIECDFTRLDGYLFLSAGDSAETLEHELTAARRAGIHDAEMLPRAPGFDTGPCLRFPRQAQFHPLRYVAALARAVTRQGGRIFTGTHVSEIRDQGQGRPQVTTSTAFIVKANAVVVATNTPVNDRVVIHTKQSPHRTFVIALELPANALAPALYWDTGASYHYVRVYDTHADGTLLLVGGEDHKIGHADDAEARFRSLEGWTRERFPMAGAVKHEWSGQVLEPVDGMAFIGRNPGASNRVFVATGDSGHGMTHGVIAGMLIRDLLLGAKNPWQRLYDPSRKSLGSVGQFARINGAVAWCYTDWLKGGDVASPADVKPGSGAVLQRGAQKLAVYRDTEGALSVCSAVCTHLGGVVHWNSEERSWDCPCHGARYSPKGEVLNGPALQGLKQFSVEEAFPRESAAPSPSAARHESAHR